MVPLLPLLALASPVALPPIDSGDTAWMLTATALVLFMVIPGLALFYAGMVRSKNILSVLMQCFAITGLISVAWVVFGYSLAFDTTGMQAGTVNLASFVGTFENAFLKNLDPAHVARDLVDDRYVRKAIEAQGGLSAFGIEGGYTRTETFEVS